MKICTQCKLEKPLTEFAIKDKTRLNSECKLCHRIYSKTHYQINKQKYINNSAKNRKLYYNSNKQFTDDYKSTKKCQACGEKEPCCLDFHHVDSKTKKFEISKRLTHSPSIEKLMNEIKKCIVLCSNCHRKLHAGKLSLDDRSCTYTT